MMEAVCSPLEGPTFRACNQKAFTTSSYAAFTSISRWNRSPSVDFGGNRAVPGSKKLASQKRPCTLRVYCPPLGEWVPFRHAPREVRLEEVWGPERRAGGFLPRNAAQRKLFRADDHRLLQAVNRGEFMPRGLRNRDLQALIYPPAPADAPLSPQERRRRAAAISRKLRLLRAHGLIQKFPKRIVTSSPLMADWRSLPS
jgi:hypothetical protein